MSKDHPLRRWNTEPTERERLERRYEVLKARKQLNEQLEEKTRRSDEAYERLTGRRPPGEET
jgi:hypothetical protein